jgi:hypothetical protein
MSEDVVPARERIVALARIVPRCARIIASRRIIPRLERTIVFRISVHHRQAPARIWSAKLTLMPPPPANVPPPAKPDSPEIKQMIEQVRADAGSRWAYAVHFWCEEPRANRADDAA